MDTNKYGYLEISSDNGKRNHYQLKPGTTSIGTINTANIRLKIKNAIPTIFCTIDVDVKENAMAKLEKKYGVILLNGKKLGKSAVPLRNEDCFQVGEKLFTYMNDSLKITTSHPLSHLKSVSRRTVMPNFKINSRSKITAKSITRPTRRSLSVNYEEPNNKLISKRSCSAVSERKYQKGKNDSWQTSEAGNVLPGKSYLLRKSLFMKNNINTTIQNSESHKISVNLNFEASVSLSAAKTTSKTNGTPATTGKLNRKTTQQDQRLSEPRNLRRRSLRNSIKPLNFNKESENEEQNETEPPTSYLISSPLRSRRLLGQSLSTGKIDTRKVLLSKLKRRSLRHSVSKLQNFKLTPLTNTRNDLETSPKSIESLIMDFDDELDDTTESSDNLNNFSGMEIIPKTPKHASFNKELTNLNEDSPVITLNMSTKDHSDFQDSETSVVSDQSQLYDSTNTDGSPMKTPKLVKSSLNDLTNVSGIRHGLKTTKDINSPLNDLSDVTGVKELLRSTKKIQKTPKNDLTDVRGVKQLLKSSRKQQKSPENNLTNVHGVKKLFSFATREAPKTPLNDLSDIRGVKQLLKSSRKEQKSPENDLTNVYGVKKLFSFATRKEPKTPLNDLSDIRGVKQLLKSSRKQQKSPENDLTNVHGVKKLFSFATREEPKTPLNDLSDVRGVKQLLKSSKKEQKSPENDLTNIYGVKKLFSFATREPKTPLNDLRDVRGVKKLLKSGRKEQKAPRNDLTDVSNLQELFNTTNDASSSFNNDEMNDNNVRNSQTNLNKSQKNEEQPGTPAIDLFDSLREETDSTFVRSAAPKVYKASKHIYKSPKNDLREVSGIDTLFQTPKIQVSLIEDQNQTNTSKLEGGEDSLQEDQPKRALRTRRKLHSERDNLGLLESDVSVTNNSNITDSVLSGDDQKSKRALRTRKRINTDIDEEVSSAQESSATDVGPEKPKRVARGRKNTNKTMANDDNSESVVKDESTHNLPNDVDVKPIRSLRGRKRLNTEDPNSQIVTPVKRSQRLQVRFDLESDVEQTPKREVKEEKDVKPKRGGRKIVQKTETEIEEKPKPKRGRKKKDEEDVIVEKKEEKPKRGRKKLVEEQSVEENLKQEEQVPVEEKPKRGRKKQVEQSAEENVKQEEQEEKPKRGRKKQANEGPTEEKPKRGRKKETEEVTVESTAEPVERVTRSTRSRKKV